tara:strand:- start:280 stop:594 length:315 start_codon:yes stop_codon:yes gene_type:complete
MLSENQIKRVLAQCEKVDESFKDQGLCGDEGPLYFDMCRNEGWMQALRLVLQEDTTPIRKDWFYAGSTTDLINKLEELVEEGKIEMVIDDDGKLYYRAKEDSNE